MPNRRRHGNDWRRRSGTARSDGLTCGRSSGNSSAISGSRWMAVLVGVIGEIHFVDIGLCTGGGSGGRRVVLLVLVVVVVVVVVMGGIT